MSHRHAICLVIDGLRASALGAYGNTIFLTPQLDGLASRSLVVEQLWADSPCLEGFYRGAWQGMHTLRSENAGASVLDGLHKVGVRQWLVSDDPWLMGQELPFDETLFFENDSERVAESVETTALGRFFAEAIGGLHQWREDVADDSSLMWLHCRGLHGAWDAPLSLRAELLDEEDSLDVPGFLQPPTALRAIEDPDVLLAHRVAYAAQIGVLDACVGAFVQAIEEEFAGSETLVMLVGSRGFALGEHGSIGTECSELFGEQLHLPWLMYRCGNTAPLPRLAGLAQPADVGATLRDWLVGKEAGAGSDGISYVAGLPGGVCQQRQLAVAVGKEGERVVRTPAWMLRQLGPEVTELYTKPDDRWESNDVAGLCGEVVEQLRSEVASFEQCCAEEKPLPLSPRGDGLIAASR